MLTLAKISHIRDDVWISNEVADENVVLAKVNG